MASNNSPTPTATTPPPQSPEETPLNKDVAKMESGSPVSKVSEKSQMEELKEKMKKPTIGTSLVLFLTLNVVMFFVGITTTKDCPIKPIIPIYLAVAGALGVVTKITPIANYKKRFAVIDYILYFLIVVEFIWMILGSIWIYGIYQPNYDPAFGEHCNKTTYLLAFWLLTLHYIFLLLSIIIPCLVFCCMLWICVRCISNITSDDE